MARTARLVLLLLAPLVLPAGCALEGVSGGSGGSGSGGGDIEDDRPDGIVCEAELSIAGTLAAVAPPVPPEEPGGCEPYGTWTITVSVSDPGDCDPQAIAIQNSYSYTVEQDPNGGYVITYTAAPDSELAGMKITEGGAGVCNGDFQHLAVDGLSTVFLKPWIEDGATIQGSGVFEAYDSSML